MVLPKIKEIINTIKFAKRAFTKGGFRHVTNYVSGLISSAKKTVKKIAQECIDEKHQSALNRVLNEAKFEKEELEKRYLKKIKYMFKNSKVFLIIDDTLVERNGKKVEETQSHYNHNSSDYLMGHQFFTAILYTPFLQLPLFPELYSKNTDSKIEMARSLVEKLNTASIKIDTVLFDSWYSEKELIEECIGIDARVICSIKANRKIRIKGEWFWRSLSFVSERVNSQRLIKLLIGDEEYKIWSSEVKLNHLPFVKLLVSQEYNKKEKTWNKAHLISTNLNDSLEEVICTYKIRWYIETYHRDIKQNLGFAKVFLRKKEGIVRHAMLVSIAYAVLSLIMFRSGKSMTIGNCCEYLRDKSNVKLIRGIVEIEDKPDRINRFEEVFISKSEKV